MHILLGKSAHTFKVSNPALSTSCCDIITLFPKDAESVTALKFPLRNVPLGLRNRFLNALENTLRNTSLMQETLEFKDMQLVHFFMFVNVSCNLELSP